MAEIKVRHTFTIFRDNGSNFCVGKYRLTEDTDNMAAGSMLIAKGTDLPSVSNVDIILRGEWITDKSHGNECFFVNCSEVLPPNEKDGIISYLCSLRVGIGKKTAEKIYSRFGSTIWDVIENDPAQVCNVKGVSERIQEKLLQKINETQAMRKLMLFFKGITTFTPNDAYRVYAQFKSNALDIVKQNVYAMCEVRGFSFQAVDAIAREMPEYDAERKERMYAAIEAVFTANSLRGHTCVPNAKLLSDLERLTGVSEKCCIESIKSALFEKKVRMVNGYSYSNFQYRIERDLAQHALRILNGKPPFKTDERSVMQFIREYEKQNCIELAEEQIEAVKSCFLTKNLCVITGGPGTGKSTIIKAILYVAESIDKDASSLLLAPTGRAARRMEEATSHDACTIHSALGISYSDEDGDTLNIGVMHDMAPLCAQIVIVDEASMCDSYIAKCLFSRIGEKTALVMVGDSDQLPSVGAGDVLSQLISSEHVPVHRLKVIFRQKAGDPIIINAAKIREGDTSLVQARSFRMCGIEDPKDIFRRTCDFYVRCVKQFSIDEVTLLIPHKRKGYLCADTLNEELEKRLNPNASGETITVMKKTFHIGDRVMQTKNTDDAKNGDVGTIVNIVDRPKKSDPYSYERCCDIDFEGGLSVSYTLSDMKNIDLAYATSVHKSQGQEFKTVIVVMAEEHNLMAKRNLLYTAVTRAKENVALIGHERTFLRAITQEKGEEDRRCTQLAYFIDILKRQKDAADASTKAG